MAMIDRPGWQRLTPAARLAIGSIVVGLVVLALKAVAWQATGSIAFLSDALESLVNVVAAGVALFAVAYGSRPADGDHLYGHAKAEYFAAVLEGVMIVGAAVAILLAAVPALLAPQRVEPDWPGIGVSLVASAINLVWARGLMRRAAALRSPALAADGRHIMADVVSSVATCLGVVLVMLTGWAILDPLLAIAVSINIIASGWVLIRASVGGLMDIAPDAEMRASIDAAIRATGQGAIEAHDLRSRVAGPQTFIEFHLVVPGDMSVDQSHAICDRIEGAIRDKLGAVTITIHVEPQGKAKQKGVIMSAMTGSRSD
jgi:cation diffusion facilitator family transporter